MKGLCDVCMELLSECECPKVPPACQRCGEGGDTLAPVYIHSREISSSSEYRKNTSTLTQWWCGGCIDEVGNATAAAGGREYEVKVVERDDPIWLNAYHTSERLFGRKFEPKPPTIAEVDADIPF